MTLRTTRRAFLRLAALLPGAIGAAFSGGSLLALPQRAHADAPSQALAALLPKSPFVYISPLLKNGRESTCHGELWYAWLDDEVVVIVSRSGWKARALGAGLKQARIWVGDHGRWKGWLFNNEAFRSAPHFDARARVVRDAELLERLLASYETKYPEEIADWRDRMRGGYADGSRLLLRYKPISAS